MSQTTTQLEAEEEILITNHVIPDSILRDDISDRCFRFLVEVMMIAEGFTAGAPLPFERSDYIAWAEGWHHSVRVLNTTVREAVRAGLLRVEREGDTTTFYRGPAL